jgi:hypothetical protein
MWQLVSTLNSSHHQTVIKEYECILILSTVSWNFPPSTIKHTLNCVFDITLSAKNHNCTHITLYQHCAGLCPVTYI